MFRTTSHRPIHDAAASGIQVGGRRSTAAILAAVAALCVACSDSSTNLMQPSAVTPSGPLAVQPAVLPTLMASSSPQSSARARGF